MNMMQTRQQPGATANTDNKGKLFVMPARLRQSGGLFA